MKSKSNVHHYLVEGDSLCESFHTDIPSLVSTDEPQGEAMFEEEVPSTN